RPRARVRVDDAGVDDGSEVIAAGQGGGAGAGRRELEEGAAIERAARAPADAAWWLHGPIVQRRGRRRDGASCAGERRVSGGGPLVVVSAEECDGGAAVFPVTWDRLAGELMFEGDARVVGIAACDQGGQHFGGGAAHLGAIVSEV